MKPSAVNSVCPTYVTTMRLAMRAQELLHRVESLFISRYPSYFDTEILENVKKEKRLCILHTIL